MQPAMLWIISILLAVASFGAFLIRYYKRARAKVESENRKQVLSQLEKEIKNEKEGQ